jgi:hypothetical protein
MVCTRPLVTALLVLAGQPAASPAVDLIGVWTGSPRGSPTQLMLAQQSDGAGAGSGGFELLCRTTDYRNPSVTPQAPPPLVHYGLILTYCGVPTGAVRLGVGQVHCRRWGLRQDPGVTPLWAMGHSVNAGIRSCSAVGRIISTPGASAASG